MIYFYHLAAISFQSKSVPLIFFALLPWLVGIYNVGLTSAEVDQGQDVGIRKRQSGTDPPSSCLLMHCHFKWQHFSTPPQCKRKNRGLRYGASQCGAWSNADNLSKGYFCTNFYIRWSCDITSQSTTIQTTNKHHHHGDGAARPSSGVDLMIPCRPRGGRPCACSFQGRCRRILFDLLNQCRNQYIFINLMFNWIRACPPATMVAKTASIVVGGSL